MDLDDDQWDSIADGLDLNFAPGTSRLSNQCNKNEFAKGLLEYEDLLYSSLFGPLYENDVKSGKFDKMTLDQVVDLLDSCELTPIYIPRDKKAVKEFITSLKKQETYDNKDITFVTKELIKAQLK
jgi:hypothetical protein